MISCLCELELKLESLKNKGFTDEQLKVEGLVILKSIVSTRPYSERKIFFAEKDLPPDERTCDCLKCVRQRKLNKLL